MWISLASRMAQQQSHESPPTTFWALAQESIRGNGRPTTSHGIFSDRQAAALEAAYPRQVHVSLTTEGVAWTVDLKEMEERSSRGQVRPVRRAALSNRDRELAEAIERSLVIQ